MFRTGIALTTKAQISWIASKLTCEHAPSAGITAKKRMKLIKVNGLPGVTTAELESLPDAVRIAAACE